MPDIRRINKEVSECASDKNNSGVTAFPAKEDDFCHFIGYIKGPDDSPYTGGVFKLHIELPLDYPFVPPKIKFDTKVWHPNVSSITGVICLDVLSTEWSPAFTIRTALLSILALLTDPEPDNPQDAVVAHQYKTNRKMFEDKAREWTVAYATNLIK